MMPGNKWRSEVDHLGASIDRCRERIDEVVQHEKRQSSKTISRLTEQYRGEVYNNGSGTTVEISIKTKKPSLSSRKPYAKLSIEETRDMNWDTLLSQDERSDIFSPSKSSQNIHGPHTTKEGIVIKPRLQKRTKLYRSPGQRCTKDPLNSRRFAQKTKSSLSKEKVGDKNLPNIRDKLIPPKSQTDKELPKQLIQEEIVRQLQIELDKNQKANTELGAKLEKLNKENLLKDALIFEKDEKIEDMKAIVARLTGTNNDMLAILTTKVCIEESYKVLEMANKKLIQELKNEQSHNRDLDAMNLKQRKEIAQLQKNINELRGSMDLHVKDVENVIDRNLAISNAERKKQLNSKDLPNRNIDSTFATVDLELSSNHSSAGNSPLPTDSPNIRVPNARTEDFGRLLPIHSLSQSILHDQGTLPFSENKDDDGDSAIGNSESHTIIPGPSSNLKDRNKEQVIGDSMTLDINTENVKISHPGQNISIQHKPKPSLGEEIKYLHKLSQEERLKQDKDASNKQPDKSTHKLFTPAALNLSETVDSLRLDISEAIDREQNLGSGSGDKRTSDRKKLEDQRKSKEEINRLKVQREQQNALLLEQQHKDDEQNKKLAEDYLIANQVS